MIDLWYAVSRRINRAGSRRGVLWLIFTVGCAGGLAACEPAPASSGAEGRVGSRESGPTAPKDHAEHHMKLTSRAFTRSGHIPTRYTAYGMNISPPLGWTGVPHKAESLALIVGDPDTPGDEPTVHWVLYSIPAHVGYIPEDAPPEPVLEHPPGVYQGENDFGENNVGYFGPAPPPGSGPHHYHFTLYALNVKLKLEPGATKEELLAAMDGHVIARTELIGMYDR